MLDEGAVERGGLTFDISSLVLMKFGERTPEIDGRKKTYNVETCKKCGFVVSA